MKSPVAVQGLPQLRRSYRLAGELRVEAKLALGQDPFGSVASLERDCDIGAGQPVVDLADPDRRWSQSETGIGDSLLVALISVGSPIAVWVRSTNRNSTSLLTCTCGRRRSPGQTVLRPWRRGSRHGPRPRHRRRLRDHPLAPTISPIGVDTDGSRQHDAR